MHTHTIITKRNEIVIFHSTRGLPERKHKIVTIASHKRFWALMTCYMIEGMESSVTAAYKPELTITYTIP